MEPMTTKSAIEIEDRRVVAKRIFDALCAHYPEKFIRFIQPRDVADALLPATDVTVAEAAWLRKIALSRAKCP
jgi:hypothetical protein